jgi:type IV pilus assembly protein PilM
LKINKRVVGLELGNFHIKSAQVRVAGGREPYLERSNEFICSNGVDRDGRVLDVESIAQSLKQLWLTAGYTTKRVALGVGNGQIFVRTLSIPKMPESKRRLALPELAVGLLPRAAEEFILDFYPIREVDSGGNVLIEGLLVAAEKQSVENLVAAVELAGLKVNSVDLVPFAVLRHFVSKEDPNTTFALVQVAGGVVTVIAARGSVPLFIRLIPLTPQVESEPLKNLDEDETDETVSNLAAASINEPNKKPVFANKAVRSSRFLDSQASRRRLVREISDTIRYFNQAEPNLPISLILLTGFTLNQEPLPADLADASGVELRPVLESPVVHEKRGANKAENSEISDELVAAVALASWVLK